MRKCIAILMAMCMVLTTLAVPSVAFGDVGTTHTVKLYMVDDNGVPDERPYFEIEVKDGQSLDAAKEEQDKYFNYPERLGYDAAWRTGTIGSDGKVQYGDTYMDSSTVESVKQDYTFYLEWMKIEPGNLGYKLTINSPDSNSVSVTEDGRSILNNMLNTAIREIANYNIESGDNYEVYEKLPKEFIIAAGKSKKNAGTVEMVFDIKETRDDQGNLTDISFDCKLKLLDADGTAVNDDNGMPIEGNIDNFDSGVGIQVALDYAAEGDCYCLLEMDDQGAVVDREESWVENGLLNYYWLVRSMSDYRLLYDEEMSGGGNGDDEPEYVVPNNQIIVSYSYYTEDSQHNFFPISITIGNIDEETGNVDLTMDEDTTIKKLVDDYGVAIDSMHYNDPALRFEEWIVTGADIEAPSGIDLEDLTIGNCGGGFRVYANAKYADGAAPVKATLCYYDADNDYCEEEMVIVIKDAKNKTAEDVYDALELAGKLNVEHSKDYAFKKWECPDHSLYQENEDLSSFYIQPIEIKATYEKQPVQVSCTYNDSGKAVTVTGQAIVDTTKPDQNLYTGFEDFLKDNDIPVAGVKGWAFNSNAYFNWEREGQPQDEITVAAIYEKSTPAYVDRYSVKCDSVDGMYYFGNDFEEVIYVDSAYPANIDIDSDYTKAMLSLVENKYNEDPGDMTFKGYYAEHVEYSNETVYQKDKDSYLYRCAPMYNVMAEYDEVYVELIGADGSIKQEVCDPSKPYILPGEPSDLWNIEGTNFGGDTIPGGSDMDLKPPYVRFSMWTLLQNPLEEAPESLTDKFNNVSQIRDDMDRKVKGEKPSWDHDKTCTEYYEVELLKATEEGNVPVDSKNFPKDGFWVMFDYPEGTDKDTDFVITHMFAEDVEINGTKHKAGDIEIIKGNRLIKTDRGVKVKVYSLSPIAVAYGDAVDTGDNDQGGIVDPPAGGESGGDNNGGATGGGAAGDVEKPEAGTDTGDNFNIVPFIVVMAIAISGIAAVLFRRKTAK